MTYATTAKLGAGTKAFFENPANPGIWKEMDNMLEVGEVGEQGEFVETTPISKTVREYIAGLETPPNKTMVFNHIPGHTNYAEFLGLVDNRETFKMRIEYPTNDRAEFTVATSGRVAPNPVGNEAVKMQVFGQQSGATTWTEI